MAKLWIEKGREKNALVVCPKQIIGKWREMVPNATVVSFDEFKKLVINGVTALVIDECDALASPAFTRQRSKRTEKMYEFIQKNPLMPVLLLSATPIRSNPWNLHTLLCYMGIYIEKQKWQDYFFTLERRPYLPRPAYFPVKDWRKKIRPILEKYADIALMRDFIEYLPLKTHEQIFVKHEPYEQKEWEPMKAFVEEHRNEQKLKPQEIINIGKQHRKVFVVAHYTEQIQTLEKILSKHKQVYTLTGATKDANKTIQEAEDDDECFFIVQASIGAGFECPSFSAMVFASMSYKVRDYAQMCARIYRSNNLHPVMYYYLLSGKRDQAIYQTVMSGRDFIPSLYMYDETSTTSQKI